MKGCLKRLAWLSALNVSCCAVFAAHAEDVQVRLNARALQSPEAVAAQLSESIAAGDRSAVADGRFTLRGVSDAQIRALRESSDVLWVESIGRGTDAVPEYHPRMLKVKFAADETVTRERVKSTLVPRLQVLAGAPLKAQRVRGQAVSVVTEAPLTQESIQTLTEALTADPSVVSVERVRTVRPHAISPFFGGTATPNDPLFSLQWALDNSTGINAQAAWALAGNQTVTVAVLDTGSTSHPELTTKWVAGYDMISERYVSQDGDERDANPSDEGDYQDWDGCDGYLQGSSWHGTHVAGIIAAQTNNSDGIAGVAPNARIMPVRVLGRCGGLIEDITDGIRWAVGAPVEGLPLNPHPAKILNLSLGGSGACTEDQQAAVDDAIARGAVLIVSAGNSSENAADHWPANCKGVITVAASNRDGWLSSFSNYGKSIEIAAPGGDDGGYSLILSTLNSGAVGQGAPAAIPYAGTSMAAPHIAGIVALMLTRDASLTPAQILNRLQTGARPMTVDIFCAEQDVTECVASGIVNAAAAVGAVADTRRATEVASAPGRLRLVELWDRTTNRFILGSDAVEFSELLSGVRGGAWERTGVMFDGYDFTAMATGLALPQPVCRFRNNAGGGDRLSIDAQRCREMAESAAWSYEGYAFQAAIANGGLCLRGSAPVYELEANGRYRYVDSLLHVNDSVASGWRSNGVVFCRPNDN